MSVLRRLAGILWDLAWSVGLRLKIMGMVVGIVLIFGLGVTTLVHGTVEAALRTQLEKRAVTVASDLAARSTDPLLVNSIFVLHGMVRDTVDNNEDVRYAFIQDDSGHVVAHTFGPGFPRALASANVLDGQRRAHLQILRTEDGLVWDVAAPILGGKAGTARVGFAESSLQAAVTNVTGSLLLITALASVIALFSAVLLTWVLTRPVLHLEQVTRSVAKGDLSVQARVGTTDEIGRLSAAFNAMIADLRRAQQQNEETTQELMRKEQLRGQLLTKVITGQEEERRRIARELHDRTGQSLTSLMVGLKVIEGADTLDEARTRVRQVRAVAADALQEVRTLAWDLRPSLLDDLGLVAALERHLALFRQQHGLDIDLQAMGLGNGNRLAPEIEVTLYRIIQEALTNVVRHADASNVSIVLHQVGQHVIVIIEDDGQGFDATAALTSNDLEPRLGLHGMRERASLVGGTVVIDSAPGKGTSVRVTIPRS